MSAAIAGFQSKLSLDLKEFIALLDSQRVESPQMSAVHEVIVATSFFILTSKASPRQSRRRRRAWAGCFRRTGAACPGRARRRRRSPPRT
ncbi:MAG: hypothetical protein JWM99_1806 [Verrucomicrobiales bacterium]|nr:hypothetical protein [Verrucomicrobiales bacterium]